MRRHQQARGDEGFALVAVVGAMLVLGSGHKGPFTWIVGFIAVVLWVFLQGGR